MGARQWLTTDDVPVGARQWLTTDDVPVGARQWLTTDDVPVGARQWLTTDDVPVGAMAGFGWIATRNKGQDEMRGLGHFFDGWSCILSASLYTPSEHTHTSASTYVRVY